mgnify:FL=1
MVAEASRVSASSSYMRKEVIREKLQEMIVDAVKSGDVKDDASLKELLSTFDMATRALAGVPFAVWQKMLQNKKESKKP